MKKRTNKKEKKRLQQERTNSMAEAKAVSLRQDRHPLVDVVPALNLTVPGAIA